MSTNEIKAGDKVEISLERKAVIEWDKAYVTKIEEVVDDGVVLIHAPMQKGRTVKLPIDAPCSLRISSDRGFYLFSARILEYFTRENFDVYSFKLTTKGEKTQRRDFFRFKCAIEVNYVVLKDNGEPNDEGEKEAMIRDMGGGGLRLLSKEIIPKSVIIRIILLLDTNEFMIFGKILRSEYNVHSVYPYQYRVQFTAMTTAEQDKLIQYIYQEQRKSLSRD